MVEVTKRSWLPKGSDCEVEALSLDHKGRAICCAHDYPDTAHILVAGLLPGERGVVRCQRPQKGEQEGRLLGRPLQKERLPAACPHVHACGGCRTQQLAYMSELAWKEANIARLFPNDCVSPIVAAPRRFGYRNKMEWSFARNLEGRLLLGLHAQGSHRIVDIEHCALVSPWMNWARDEVRRWGESEALSAFNARSGSGCLRSLTLREGRRSGERMAILQIDATAQHELKNTLSSLQESLRPIVQHLVLRTQFSQKGTPTRFEQEILFGSGRITDWMQINQHRLQLFIDSTSFAQPNPAVAELIYAAVMQSLERDGGVVLDLFAGSAVMGILASLAGHRAISVELHAPSCAIAEELAHINGVGAQLQIVCADVAKFLAQLPQTRYQVILDPPRAGCGDSICRWLVEAPIQRIIYVACNPITQWQDCQTLIDGGFAIEQIQPFDQFPNTAHIENIVTLSRNLTDALS